MLRQFRGVTPRVHESAHVDPSAQVIGDVEIGEESSVWMNVVMRGTHQTTIGNDVTIGHAALVHGCTMADRILVGMGAILLNGVDVGEDSIVAAGTLITEQSKIPPRSLVVGSPGKVKRPLTDAEVASILDYSERYVGYRLDYMQA